MTSFPLLVFWDHQLNFDTLFRHNQGYTSDQSKLLVCPTPPTSFTEQFAFLWKILSLGSVSSPDIFPAQK